MSRRAIPIVAIVLMALAMPHTAAAAACTVPTAAYPTIQSAVDDPNCNPIRVKRGTFNEDVVINRGVTILGAGSGRTTVDGLGSAPVFEMPSGTPVNVTIADLTITGGGGPAGGGIRSINGAHSLTLRDVIVTGNTADNVAGVFFDETGTLRITGGSVSGNTTPGSVGGVGVTGDGAVVLDGVRVDGNTATNAAGGFFTGALDITGSSFSSNTASNAVGGIQSGSVFPLTIRDTVVSGNSAGGPVGGMFLDHDGPVTIEGLLLDGNDAVDALGGAGIDGAPLSIRDTAVTNNVASNGPVGGMDVEAPPGMALDMTNVTVSGNQTSEFVAGLLVSGDLFTGTNLTITNNVADSDAGGDPGDYGGILLNEPGELVNSIISGNIDRSPGPVGPDVFGTVNSLGHNIVGSTAGATWNNGPGDMFGVDPMLGPLMDNGGDTLTHVLLRGSPAINNADKMLAPKLDQRGAPRSPDIGAYERVVCKKVLVNRVGTPGRDVLQGTGGRDGILGLGGKDTIRAKRGKDAVCAGGGKDLVKGGGGKDKLFGQGGRDTLVGGGGKDRCVGGGGKDDARGCERERRI